MSYYILPRNDIHTYKNIELFFDDKNPTPIISNSLSFYLYDIKKKIDKQVKDWDIFKKYTNPYEYINTIVPNLKKCVSKNKYLSRSYFKMVEIIYTFDIRFFPPERPILSFHLAEGPGGFIEALLDIRNCSFDNYVGMTILEDMIDPNIPGWKKTSSFLKKNPNVTIETGSDKTGNILSLDNFEYCAKKYASSMDFITADGGFDFSLDFNKQEMHMANLLFAQISFAVSMQKKNGCFVLKIFDCFMQHTVDLLYILSSFYDKTFIFKPNTSRFANSEKYIVCKGFLFDNNDSFYPFLYKAFQQMVSNPEKIIHRFLRVPLSYHFVIKLEEYNVFFGEKQIENIQYTLTLIENKNKQDKINMLVSNNIQKCVSWCIKHNIDYNHM